MLQDATYDMMILYNVLMILHYVNMVLYYVAVTVAQSEDLPRVRKVGCSNPNRDKPK